MKGNQWPKTELSKWFTKCVCPHCSMWSWCCLELQYWEKDPIWLSTTRICYSGWFSPSGMHRLTWVTTKMSSEMLAPRKKQIHQNSLMCFCLHVVCLSTRYCWSTPSVSEEKKASKQTNKNCYWALNIHLFLEKELLISAMSQRKSFFITIYLFRAI